MTHDDNEVFPLGGTLTIDFGENESIAIIDLETNEVSDIPLMSTRPN